MQKMTSTEQMKENYMNTKLNSDKWIFQATQRTKRNKNECVEIKERHKNEEKYAMKMMDKRRKVCKHCM